MPKCSIIFIEKGFPEIPGIIKKYPSFSFPFWGDYYILDFALANFQNQQIDKYLVAEEGYEKLLSLLANRWNDEHINIFTTNQEIDPFLDFIKSIHTDFIILSSLSYITVFNSRQINKLIPVIKNNILKISIDAIPVDMYLVEKKAFLKILDSYITRLRQSHNIERILFDDILLHSFETIVDIGGKILFHNNLRQIFRQNLHMVNNLESNFIKHSMIRFKNIKMPNKESYIADAGFVKNSCIASGVEIEGYVENSIIFPDVIIMKQARILNSVIMNNNKIGYNSQISNTIILPFIKDNSKIISNIGENCTIGGKSGVKNRDFPEQIAEGITALGMNVEIPRGLVIEPGCYIGPNISHYKFKDMEIIKKSKSIM